MIWSFQILTQAAWLVPQAHYLPFPQHENTPKLLGTWTPRTEITLTGLSKLCVAMCLHSGQEEGRRITCVLWDRGRQPMVHRRSMRSLRMATAALEEVLKESANILCHFLLLSGRNVSVRAGVRAASWNHEVLRRMKQQDRRRLGLWRSRSHLASLELPASRLIIRQRDQYLSHLSHFFWALCHSRSTQHKQIQLVQMILELCGPP